MGTYYKQVAAYKTAKGLIEFVDDTRYEQEVMAWPHLHNSRIRINMKDYSKGTGEKAIDVFYNLSPEEFMNLAEAIRGIRQVSAAEKKRWDTSVAVFSKMSELYRHTSPPQEETKEIRELIEQFQCSRNEVFAEAGEKLSAAFERLLSGYSSAFSTGLVQMEKLLTGAKKEKETATKVREVFQAIKILNFDKYINPDNETERRVTAIRVAYAGYMDYPFVFEINNGWGKPVITRNNGVITEEGSVHYEDSVKVYMKEEHLFPMLQRVNLFIQAMTVQGMEKYFDRVSSPILNSEAE